ncbi:LysM domain-containing protein [Paraphoma chrysanthemicola]|uniref:LysM domain-containing protein n=1 Tax=Paraphoma chrysanthemicola TaxID=798071 RepID=A0A8K0QXW3_9PLEO|nr:LysM domain-containing protein [Paraphoma chrysanthemicola]
MSIHRSMYFALAASLFFASSALPEERQVDGYPIFPYDDKTTKDCTYWVNYDGSQDCAQMLEENWATLENFRRWNPSIGPNCSGLTKEKSYCVEAIFEAPPGVTTKVPSSSTTPTPTPTSTPTVAASSKGSSSPTLDSSSKTLATSLAPSPTIPVGSGIETPLPTQQEIVSNCDHFYRVKADEEAGAVPTPTNPGNGIATPQPPQPDRGDQCASIAAANGITFTQFQLWNPRVGANCGGPWAESYACIRIVAHTPGPAPTKPLNGMQTLSPTQFGMTTICRKFDLVKPGEICDTITKRNGISLANFTK